jgi:AcrR family transcriptional regulator
MAPGSGYASKVAGKEQLQMKRPVRRRNIDPVRRAEIGAEKRSRTKAALLDAARELFGHEEGHATRIEDVCERAGIARGTFYNHFDGMDALQQALGQQLSLEFDNSVHRVFVTLETPAAKTSAAIRYYLGRAAQEPKWGWAMVHTGMARSLFGEGIANRALATLQEGIDAGEFTLPSAQVGRDMLLGTSLAAVITLLRASPPAGYVEQVTRHILMGFGISESEALALTRHELPPLDSTHSEARPNDSWADISKIPAA